MDKLENDSLVPTMAMEHELLEKGSRKALAGNAAGTPAVDWKHTRIQPELGSLRVTPADGIGMPTTPQGHHAIEARVNAEIQTSKQRLVEIGYTNAQGNILRPELGALPKSELSTRNGRLPAQRPIGQIRKMLDGLNSYRQE